MNIQFDCELTPDQWETLKAVRAPVTATRPLNRAVVEKLVALGLASTESGLPAITPLGRQVLIRGSSRLLDVAA